MNPLWLPLAIVAYSIFAVTSVGDKFLVTNKLRSPVIVSFWVGLFGIPSALILLVGLVPAPWAQAFRFHAPSLDALMLITATGLLLQLALFLSYAALWRGEATRVVPTIGAAQPAFTLIFAYAIIGERLPTAGIAAFALLFAGALTISIRRGRWGGSWLLLALGSAAAAALQTTLAKLIYGYSDFISSFALFGLGNVVWCLVLAALSPAVRREITNALRPKPARRSRTKVRRFLNLGAVWIFANTIIGSVGVIILNLSIKLGPVSLVNALRGLQYVGLFLIALLLAHPFPKLLHEELSAQTVRQKLLAIALISAGIGLLVVTQP